MSENDLLSVALKIAMDAHEGQTDKGGKPYILHPLAVAAQSRSYDEFVTALLHDVLEDSAYTEEDLRAAGIPEHILRALAHLTHRKDEPYLDYVRRIGTDPLARAVKLADLRHNSDLSRLPAVTDADRERVKKYQAAMEILAEGQEG